MIGGIRGLTPERLQRLVDERTEEVGDCLIWTGSLQGGCPALNFGGTPRMVRRLIYEARTGQPVPKGKVMRCTCTEKLCVAHFEPSSYRRIAKDAGARGLMSDPLRTAKISAARQASSHLTWDVIRAFRASEESGASFARRVGISHAQACRIRNGKAWKEALPSSSVFSWRPA